MAMAALLVYGSFVPFQFVPLDFQTAFSEFGKMFENPWGRAGSRVDWSINFLVTVPLGFFGMGTLLANRSSFARKLWVAPLVIVAVCGLSFAVEFGQLWFSGRVPSLRDVIAQLLGTLAGSAIWLLLGPRITCWLDDFASQRGPSDKFELALQAYLVGLIAYSMLPLDVITTPGEFARKYGNGQFELVPFSYYHESAWRAIYSYVTQVFLFIPIGVWAASVGKRFNRLDRGFLESWMLGILVVLAIEAAQAMLVSRYTSTTDLILGSSGSAIGVLIARRWRAPVGNQANSPTPAVLNRFAASWILAAVAYAFILVAVFWAPYDFTRDRPLIKERLQAFGAIPFSRMQAGSEMLALFSSIRMLTWFAPLGLLLGVGIASLTPERVARRFALVIAIAAIAVLAIGIEVGQVLLPDKFADSTDALICTGGGIFGLWLANKFIGRTP